MKYYIIKKTLCYSYTIYKFWSLLRSQDLKYAKAVQKSEFKERRNEKT